MANRAWGDEDDDELPQNTESEVDANGMKEVVEYSLTPTGQRKKVTKKIKVITHVERISKRRIERQKRLRGHRFGDATDTADDSNVTITDYDQVGSCSRANFSLVKDVTPPLPTDDKTCYVPKPFKQPLTESLRSKTFADFQKVTKCGISIQNHTKSYRKQCVF